jgi:hypothetical protein
MRPRTTASKKRRQRVKIARRMKKNASRVMPMLSRPKKAKPAKPAKPAKTAAKSAKA